MTREQAKSELMQIYMSLSEDKKKAIDVLIAPAYEKKLADIRNYLIENIFRDPGIMFDENCRSPEDLPRVIASLYEVLHRIVTGEPYEYMFHWANKCGSWVEDDLFIGGDQE